MTDYYVLFACYCIEAAIAYIYFNENYKSKFSSISTLFISFGIHVTIFLICTFLFGGNVWTNTLLYFVGVFVFAYLCYDISFKTALFQTSIIIAIMFSTEMIGELVLSDSVILLGQGTPIVYFVFGLTSKSLMLIILYFIAKWFSYKRNNAVGEMKNAMFLLSYPVSYTVFLYYQFYLLLNYEITQTMKWVNLVFSIAGIILTCFIFIYNQRIQKRENELAELEKQQMKNEIDMQYLDLLEMKNREMQILTHDYKNHLAAIRDMSSSEEVAEYIDKMNDEIKTANSACNSGNHMLDILINKYVAECYSKNIDFTYDVKLCNLNYVESFDLVTILGNALDNALEAAEKSEEKKISFSTKRVNTYDTIIIENSCDIPPDSKLKTTKKNQSSHGLGMKSIAKTLKKYGGDYEWEYSQTDKQFKLTIILQNK